MKKKSYHHKNLPAALLEMTARIIAFEGQDQVTLRELARRLGVSRTAPYRHFTDKNSLLAAVAEQYFHKLNFLLLSQIEPDPQKKPLNQLRNLANSYLNFATKNPEIYRLMFGDGSPKKTHFPRIAEKADETLAILVQAIFQCHEAANRTDEDREMLAQVAWSTLHGTAVLINDGKLQFRDGDRQAFRFTIDTLVGGLLKLT